MDDLGKDVQKINEFITNIKKDQHESVTETAFWPLNKNKKRSGEDNGDKCKQRLEALKLCLKRNYNCHSLLKEAECYLVDLLEDCRKELKVVNEEICFFNQNCVVKKKRSKGHMMFAIPYFKDKDGFSCRSNRDVAWLQAAGYFNPLEVPKVSPWMESQKWTLKKAIRKVEVERWVNITKNAGTESFSHIKSKTLQQLVGLRWVEYDWLKISVTDLKNARSPHECRSVWFNYLHPQINKTKWSKAEDKKLTQLVKKHKNQDWDAIAEELNTSRSAFQCACHYSNRLSESSAIPWNKEQNTKLIKYVEQFRIGHYIPWGKIAVYFDGRSRNNVYKHWKTLSSKDKKGKFSEAEDIVIVAGLRLFGSDFKQIAKFLPQRNSNQVRSRITRLMRRQKRPGPWTPDEDSLLVQLVDKYGFGSWVKVSEHFINRDNQHVRHRYKTILKKKDKPHTLGPGIRPGEDGTNMEDLWAKALTVLQANGYTPDVTADITKLSKAVLRNVKAGRKKGQVKQRNLLEKLYYNFFSCAYAQRGGRGKAACSKDKVPGVARGVSLMLQFFGASLTIPDVDVINADTKILDLDKSVLKFLKSAKHGEESAAGESSASADQEEEVMATASSVGASSSIGSAGPSSRQFCCPPNSSTLVGFRTLLLSHSNLTQQATLGLYELNDPRLASEAQKRPQPASDAFFAAKQLFTQRLHSLFTWPAVLSKNHPTRPFKMTNGFQFKADETAEEPKERERERKK